MTQPIYYFIPALFIVLALFAASQFKDQTHWISKLLYLLHTTFLVWLAITLLISPSKQKPVQTPQQVQQVVHDTVYLEVLNHSKIK